MDITILFNSFYLVTMMKALTMLSIHNVVVMPNLVFKLTSVNVLTAVYNVSIMLNDIKKSLL